ncbi:MAG: hypothetical protein V4565_03590 [Bacteroidota bacterium]
MKKQMLGIGFTAVMISCIFFSCKKDIGQNPLLAFTDKALLDSANNTVAFAYYKNDPTSVYSGTNGPHGAFKLKFNKKALLSLTDNGKLPAGQKFPDGSMIVKEIPSNGLYAIMYKKSGSWLWSEVNKDGTVAYSVNKNGDGCIGCHSQTGHRDLVVSFNFY